MKVPKENISFQHKSKLRKEAFADEEISKILRGEGAATQLNREVKARLKKTRTIQLVYWIGASAASAILLFFLISQLYTEQNQVAETQDQQLSTQNERPCNLDSLFHF
jgi:capsular polysaccharide biosynthesis protein